MPRMAEARTNELWAEQNRHPGDRTALFSAAEEQLSPTRVLYPGSFVDVAASFVFRDVTYVDSDSRAKRFFADRDGVERIVDAAKLYEERARFDFVHADYTSELPLAEGGYDLLVSLYAGFVSRACKRYLRTGGLLLTNNSHGDAGMASIDPEFELSAVINKRGQAYRSSTHDLDAYLVPKGDGQVTRELLERTNRGVGYTRSPSAYLFRKAGGTTPA